jgi:hypothetical protein
MAIERPSQDELLVNALVDGELMPRERAAAAARLAGDREFARAYATLTRLKAAVIEVAEDAGAIQVNLPLGQERRMAALAGAGVALAAAIAVAVGVAINWRGPEERLVEMQSQTVTLASFNQTAVLPDLAPAGLKLAGTLIQPSGRGQVLIATYLGPRGCRLELRVQPAVGAVVATGGTDRRSWQVGDLVYQLIAYGMPAERFAAVAEAAERATRGGSPGGVDRQLREARVFALPCLA